MMKQHTTQAIAYYRVSTQKQGHSGLGLDAQRQSVNAYATGRYTIAAEFVEVESGSKAGRIELAKALAMAKEVGAVLLIAKLDRLARSVAFTSKLMDSGVQFVAVDMPDANNLTIHIIAAIAEHERELIRTRTKSALAQAKARGTVLGTLDNLTEDGRAMGREAMATAAKDAYKLVFGYITALRDNGLTLAAIAEKINSEGHKTRNGAAFTAATVSRIIKRGRPQK